MSIVLAKTGSGHDVLRNKFMDTYFSLRFAITISCVFVSSLIQTDMRELSAADGKPKRELMKVLLPGNPSKRIVGEKVSEDGTSITIQELPDFARVKVPKQGATIKDAISDREAISTVGLDAFLAWKITCHIPIGKASGKIARVDGEFVYVNIGENERIEKGDRLAVYRTSGDLVDPDTGEKLGKERRKVAEMRVLEVHPKFSKTRRADDSEHEFKIGDIVETVETRGAIAVLPFTSSEQTSIVGGTELSEKLITGLSRSGMIVVERAKLANLIAELAIDNSGLVESESVQRLGKMLGAYAILTGSMVEKGKAFEAQIRLIRVETGEVLFTHAEPVKSTASGARSSTSERPRGLILAGRNDYVDALVKIDVAKDTFKGSWSYSEGVLRNSEPQSRIVVPLKTKDTYELEVKFVRTAGTDSVSIALPVMETSCELNLSGYFGQAHGIQVVDGKGFDANTTTVRPGKLENGRENTVHVKVTGNRLKKSASIEVHLNGDKIIAWTGETKRLAVGPLPPEDRSKVALGVSSCSVEFRAVSLKIK